MHYLFIYLFICFSNRMVALLLCYHLLLYAPLKVISVLVLFVIFGGSFQSIIRIPLGLHRLPLQLRWPCLQSSFLSAHFAATCSQPTTRRQLTVTMSILSYFLRYSFRYLRVTVVADRDHLYLNRNNQSMLQTHTLYFHRTTSIIHRRGYCRL